jgi:hypothetical protein
MNRKKIFIKTLFLMKALFSREPKWIVMRIKKMKHSYWKQFKKWKSKEKKNRIILTHFEISYKELLVHKGNYFQKIFTCSYNKTVFILIREKFLTFILLHCSIKYKPIARRLKSVFPLCEENLVLWTCFQMRW